MQQEIAPASFIEQGTTFFIDQFKIENVPELQEIMDPLNLSFRFASANPSAWTACELWDEVAEMHDNLIPKLRAFFDTPGKLVGLLEAMTEYPVGKATVADAKDGILRIGSPNRAGGDLPTLPRGQDLGKN